MKRLKITFNAPIVLGFVFICFIVTLLNTFSMGHITQKFFMTYHSDLKDPLTYLRLFTHVFGHDGWSHFIGNASYLLLLGPMLEEKYKSTKIFEIILITAFITGLINYLFFWNIALCGASGIVFAFILLTSFTGFKNGDIPMTFILVTIIFIGQQIFDGITVKDNISNISHIVGGMVGAFAGYNLNKK